MFSRGHKFWSFSVQLAIGWSNRTGPVDVLCSMLRLFSTKRKGS